MSYASQIAADGATHLWLLGEPSGTGAADSIGTDTGTAGAGATRGVAGPAGIGAAIGMAGASTSLVSTATNSAHTYSGPNSIECWFKTSAAGGIISYDSSQTGGNSEIGFYVGSDGKLYFAIYNGGVIDILTAVITNNAWHHAVGVMAANNNMSLYLDGALVAGPSANTLPSVSNAYWQLGDWPSPSGWPNNTTQYLTGSLCAVAIYDSTALSVAQIANHYQLGLGAPPPTRSPITPLNTLMRGVRNLGQMALLLGRQAAPPPASGPAVLTASVADTSLTSDSLSRVLFLPRSMADTSASSDGATPATSEPRSVADTSVSSDAVARSAQAFARSSADASVSSDAATRTVAFPRATADTSASSDATTRLLALARTIADTSQSSDAASRVLHLPRATADTSASSDVVTGSTAAHYNRSTADTSLSSDAVATVTHFPRSTADSTTSADAVARQLSSPRAASDTSLSSDATTRAQLHYARSSADTSLSSDGVTHGPAPTPPCITEPTFLIIAPYTSTAAVVNYTSAAHASAYSSTLHIASYTSAVKVPAYTSTAHPGAYTSAAAVVSYSSSAAIGPRFCA